MDWSYFDDTWICGTFHNGCGVYCEEGEWWANVVYGNIECIGPFDSKEEAMERAIDRHNYIAAELQ